jgi:hypothetical protein
MSILRIRASQALYCIYYKLLSEFHCVRVPSPIKLPLGETQRSGPENTNQAGAL